MRLSIPHLVVATSLVFSSSVLDAQEKKGITDLAQVDADYAIQGEYAGNVAFSDGYCRVVGLQVVTLGQGKFDALWHQGGLPGNGYDGSTRSKLSGRRADFGVQLQGDNIQINLQDGNTAIVKNTSGGYLGSLTRYLRYSPTEGLPAPANAIVLFDGKNGDRFKNAKITADGLLEVGTETKDPVKNFTLHAEFRTPYMPSARGQQRGNSGFYLQKRYEVQVLDSFGLEQQKNDCASLYQAKAPDLNMSFPPLRWQTYDIDFTAPQFDADGKRTVKGRITVRHNGVIVQNDLELQNKTGAGSPEGPNPLPIVFQNHGDAVHFRNIWLIDRDAYPAVAAVTCCPDVTCRHPRPRRCR